MRLNINLASRRFEDVRQFYVRWTIAIIAAALFTLLLLGLVVMNYSSSSQSSGRIRDLKDKLASLEKQRAAAESISNRPENHDVNAQKNYWNQQISRRQLSWTQLFNDLQRIMPARAFLKSVHPEIAPDRRLKLRLEIVGDTHENGLELVKKMEKSERFRGPIISNEMMEKDQKSGAQFYKFSIETYYTPAASPRTRSATREGL
jgi:hypothetical protein